MGKRKAATPRPPLPADEFSVYCLASGSTGNAILLVAGGAALLIDAGLGVRTLKRELEARKVAPAALSGILLTHEHNDHVQGAIPFARQYDVPLIATSGTLRMLFAHDRRDAPHRVLEAKEQIGLGPFGIYAAPITHDAADPTGFRVECGTNALAYATDTGTVTPEFGAACDGVSLLAIESNHDIHKLRFGPYPDALKARILGRNGHLSNNAACDLILAHTERSGPSCVWLLHLSEVNNTPKMAMNYWKTRYREAGHRDSPASVEVALRDVPSLVYRARSRAVQLALF
ncbi:MAG: MBL fold metallo-hydrolase [Capsulimonadales bacterium]|nr:MBL fold metallo-hydrolase [Capsulimonadales bacterium]